MKSRFRFRLSFLILFIAVMSFISACYLPHRAFPAVRIADPGSGSVHDVNAPLEIRLEPSDVATSGWEVIDNGVSVTRDAALNSANYSLRTSLIPRDGGVHQLTVRVHFQNQGQDYGWREASLCYFVRDNGANTNPPDGWPECIITIVQGASAPTATATVTLTPTSNLPQLLIARTPIPALRDLSTPSHNNRNDQGGDTGAGDGGSTTTCQPPPDNCGDGVWDPNMCACGPG